HRGAEHARSGDGFRGALAHCRAAGDAALGHDFEPAPLHGRPDSRSAGYGLVAAALDHHAAGDPAESHDREAAAADGGVDGTATRRDAEETAAADDRAAGDPAERQYLIAVARNDGPDRRTAGHILIPAAFDRRVVGDAA